MYGATAPPTARQVLGAARLIKQTDASLTRYANVQAAFAAGYTYVLKTNGEEHLLYDGNNPGYQGLHPQHPSSLVYAINVPGLLKLRRGAHGPTRHAYAVKPDPASELGRSPAPGQRPQPGPMHVI